MYYDGTGIAAAVPEHGDEIVISSLAMDNPNLPAICFAVQSLYVTLRTYWSLGADNKSARTKTTRPEAHEDRNLYDQAGTLRRLMRVGRAGVPAPATMAMRTPQQILPRPPAPRASSGPRVPARRLRGASR